MSQAGVGGAGRAQRSGGYGSVACVRELLGGGVASRACTARRAFTKLRSSWNRMRLWCSLVICILMVWDQSTEKVARVGENRAVQRSSPAWVPLADGRLLVSRQGGERGRERQRGQRCACVHRVDAHGDGLAVVVGALGTLFHKLGHSGAKATPSPRFPAA